LTSSLPAKVTTMLVPDVLEPNLKAVFCGTALGHESARQRAYYAHPGNAFWKALHRIGLTPEQVSPQDYPQVTRYGIGLTDMCKHASGNDHELPEHAFDADALEEKIRRAQPEILAFTSKNAAAAYLQRPVGRIPYGWQDATIGRTRLYVLSSPSGQARRWWREDIWQALADAVHASYST